MEPNGPEELSARMDALTEANLRLLRRVGELGKRVAHLDGGAAEAAMPEQAPAPVWTRFDAPPAAETAPELAAEPVSAREETREEEFRPAPAPEPEPAMAHQSTETTVGLTWANRAGALTLIIGAAFFFKYAVDNAWIGPTARVLLGILAGGALVAWSERARGLLGFLGGGALLAGCYRLGGRG